MNEGAGRGEPLYITLRLEGGENVPLMVDTGSPFTILDSSLASKLGKHLKYRFIHNPFYRSTCIMTEYSAPALYLGTTRLTTGPHVLCGKNLAILGMDCLRHYCVQLDFAARKIRFLDPDHLDTASLGQAFPMPITIANEPILNENLLGTQGIKTMIDSGDNTDGSLNAREFRKLSRGNQSKGGGWVWLPNGALGGVTYSNLLMHRFPGRLDTLGLRFLARNLVTFNFPKRTLYLRPRTTNSPVWADLPIAPQLVGPMQFLASLHQQGRLPGFSKTDYCVIIEAPNQSELAAGQANGQPFSRTFRATNNRDQPPWKGEYHYTVTKATKTGHWHLQKAWRTDAKGRVVEEYRVR